MHSGYSLKCWSCSQVKHQPYEYKIIWYKLFTFYKHFRELSAFYTGAQDEFLKDETNFFKKIWNNIHNLFLLLKQNKLYPKINVHIQYTICYISENNTLLPKNSINQIAT